MTTTQSLTYDELAQRLGISPESARNLVRRKRWGRQPGNDGRTRVQVPLEVVAAHPPMDGATKGAADPPADGGAEAAAVAVLERHIVRLESEVAALKAERDADRAMALSVGALMAGLESEIKGLQAMVAELRQARDGWQEAARAALARPSVLPSADPPQRWWPWKRRA